MTNKGIYLQQGTVLDGKYQIEQVIGHGGFGITYKGSIISHAHTPIAVKELFISEYVTRDSAVSTDVILKNETCRRYFAKAKEDFLKEAIILGIMNKEPAVVNVIDRFKDNGTAYIVMEYVQGKTLVQYIKEHGVFSDKEIFRKILPIAATLQKIHENELIHGDISPENIMYQEDGTLKLIDFGSAGSYISNEIETSTIKDGYAAPEQYGGSGRIGPWTDVYGLCATLYYCLTGMIPDSSAHRTLYDELQKPSETGIKMESALEQILWKGLAVETEERYQKMELIEQELRRILPTEKKMLPTAVKVAGVLLAAGVFAVTGVWGYELYQEKNKFNGIETEKAVLIPEDNMTVNNFVEARQIVEERIKILSGELPYTVEEKEDGSLCVVTPLSIFADYDALEFYDMMISGVWNTEIGRYEEKSGDYLRCPIKYDDFETVALQMGVNSNMTAEQSELIQAEANKYIYLVLKDEKAEEIREIFPEESILQLYLDFQVEERVHDSISVSVSEDGKEMYLYGNFIQKGRFGELLAYNLSHQTFEQNFNLYGEIATDWESPDGSMLTGEYQRRESEIASPSVTVSYAQDEQSALQLSKGEWAYILVNLKERLDQFKVPYAIGAEKDDPGQIVLKLKMEDTTTFILDTLMEKGYTVTLAGRWREYGTPVSEKKGSMELIHGENGDYRYSVRLEKEEWKDFQKFTEKLLDDKMNELFIKIGEYYVVKCVITEPITDGRIIFDQFCDERESSITEENRYLLDYLSTFAVDTSGFAYYELDKMSFKDEKGDISVEQSFFREEYLQDFKSDFLEKAEALYPQITYEDNLGVKINEISIHLNLEVSDGFVEHAMGMIEKIYYECGLEEGWLNNITFILTEENLQDQEMARIHFIKNQEKGEGYLMNVQFQNGRMELYKEKLEERVTNMQCYSDIIVTGNEVF